MMLAHIEGPPGRESLQDAVPQREVDRARAGRDCVEAVVGPLSIVAIGADDLRGVGCYCGGHRDGI